MTDPVTKLVSLMERLRDPERGCAWDREQTFDTLAAMTRDETYELIQAIDNNDIPNIKEELGDLLFHVIFYAQIARENNLFTFDDVANEVNDKLVRRHRHVFGDDKASTPEEIAIMWERVKAEEKARKAQKASTGPQGLDFGSPAMPALMRTAMVAKRADANHYFWDNPQDIMKKVFEEVNEVEQATSNEHREEEIGDALFTLACLAYFYKIDPERALQKANNKLIARWQKVYELVKKDGKELQDLERAELEEYQARVKKSA